jgi:hypothetical protein
MYVLFSHAEEISPGIVSKSDIKHGDPPTWEQSIVLSKTLKLQVLTQALPPSCNLITLISVSFFCDRMWAVAEMRNMCLYMT